MKLLHFTDTHLRLPPMPRIEHNVQPLWDQDMRVLFERIGRLTEQVDAVVFSGDATHGGGKPQAARFFELLAMAVVNKPVFMVLGNHDVVNPAWRENFLDQARAYPNIQIGDGIYPLGDIDLMLMHGGYASATGVVTPEWHPEIFPVPGLSDASAGELNAALSRNSTRPVVAVTHCPTHFLPPSVLGFAPYVGNGMDIYRKQVHGLLNRHPRVRCVLSGHIHFNSEKVLDNGRVHQSLASLGEYPCQVRLVELTDGKLESSLVSLATERENIGP